jgi:hypothetical protein
MNLANLKEGLVSLGIDQLTHMNRLDRDLSTAMIIRDNSPGFTPDEDQIWVGLAKPQPLLSEEVIPLTRHPPAFTIMKESKFRELWSTGGKLFLEYTSPQRAHTLQYHGPAQKTRMVTEWEQFSSKAEALLYVPDCDIGGAVSATLAKGNAALSGIDTSIEDSMMTIGQISHGKQVS